MKKVRMGIIGIGNMGTAHCRNIYEGKVPEMELSAVCDISKARELSNTNAINTPISAKNSLMSFSNILKNKQLR